MRKPKAHELSYHYENHRKGGTATAEQQVLF